MKKKISKKIIDDFAEKLSAQHFLGKAYTVYIFSLASSQKSNNFSLKLEASAATRNFDESNGFPIPRRTNTRLKISFRNYQRYAYCRGGNICSFKSIVNDHNRNNGKKFLEAPKLNYWENKHVYYCGYEFDEAFLVVFLIFDFDPDKPPGNRKPNDKSSDEKAEKELISLYLRPELKRVEDTYHKQHIFNKKYLKVLQERIDKDMFKPIYKSLKDLRRNFQYTEYLQKIYYDFLIENLWMYEKQLNPLHQEQLLLLTREFEKNQKNLFIIRNYRDHFLHQYNVYILGIAIINTMKGEFGNDIVSDFNRSYRLVNEQEYNDIYDVSTIWFLASMFHDIAYPVEKSGQWLDAFFQRYIFPKKDKAPILNANINISNVISDIDYNKCIEDLAEFHRKLNFGKRKINYEAMTDKPNINRGCEIRSQILDQTIRHRDHGILSATMLLHRFRGERQMFRFLFPAAAAISIHNYLWTDRDILHNPCRICKDDRCEKCTKWKASYEEFFERWGKRNHGNPRRDKVENLRYMPYDKNPIAFLLITCDLLHDWGRYNFENLGKAFDPYFNPCQLAGIECDNNSIVFDIEIKAPSDPDTAEKIKDFLRYKKQEIVKIFSRLQFIKDHDIVIRLFSKIMHPIEFSMNYFSR